MCRIVDEMIEERMSYAMCELWDNGYGTVDEFVKVFGYPAEKIKEILGKERLTQTRIPVK